MRTQRRKHAIAKTPRKEDGEAGSPAWPPASFLLKMAKSSRLVCICYSAGVAGEGGACLLAGFWNQKGTFLRIPFGLSTLTSEMSGLLPSALRPSPHSLHPSPASSPSPPGSYRLAPNQLDAATLGSAALARERHPRPWHCGKPKAAEHAHDRHLAAGRGARTGVPGTGRSPAGGQHKDVLHSGAESEPSRQPQLRLPPRNPPAFCPHHLQEKG